MYVLYIYTHYIIYVIIHRLNDVSRCIASTTLPASPPLRARNVPGHYLPPEGLSTICMHPSLNKFSGHCCKSCCTYCQPTNINLASYQPLFHTDNVWTTARFYTAADAQHNTASQRTLHELCRKATGRRATADSSIGNPTPCRLRVRRYARQLQQQTQDRI